MEQYKNIDQAFSELKEKYERPVVVEQFSNPKSVDKRGGTVKIFINQAVVCVIIAVGLFISKLAFPDVFNLLYGLIIENISAISML